MSAAAAEAAFRAGDPAAALALLQAEVRQRPQDLKLRLFLAQLLMVLGQWERAQNQLGVIAELDAGCLPMARTYETAIRCEQLRAQIFAGQRSPLVFGEPPSWLAPLIQALALSAPDQTRQAAALRSQAFEEAPASGGSLNGTAFEWLSDADSRLGPVLEVLLNGAYYWVPLMRISRISVEPPSDIRDLVWLPATFRWSNGGEAMGLIPTRYSGSERIADAQVLLARRTEWTALGETGNAMPEPGAEQYAGLGQRVLASDVADYGLLDVREIVFTPAA